MKNFMYIKLGFIKTMIRNQLNHTQKTTFEIPLHMKSYLIFIFIFTIFVAYR